MLEAFPGIVDRAGYLLDQDALNTEFAVDFEKEDLTTFYSRAIQEAISRDVPVIGAALSKLNGWDEPEKHMIAQVSEVRHILDSISEPDRLAGAKYCPLPADSSKG